MRLAKRGLAKPGDTPEAGDLFAIVKIVMPPILSAREKELYAQLAEAALFNPRKHFTEEPVHAN